MMKKEVVLAAVRCATVVTACATGPVVHAQAYPTKPLRMVVPFPPGGGTDLMGRMIGQKLGEAFGHNVVIDNRGGAGGTIGTENVAKSPPDGYTIGLASVTTLSMNPLLYPKLGFDPVRDLAPVGLFATTPQIVVVHPSLPVRTLKELIAFPRPRPGQLNYGTAGSGTSPHLSTELFRTLAGIDLVHVPYKGSSPAVTDLVGGHVSLMVNNMPTLLPLVKAGKVRALAVASRERSPVAPEVPTAAESGFPGYEVDIWYGVVAPAGTAREVIFRLNAELQRAAGAADVRERLGAQGAVPAGGSPEAFGQLIRNELERWRKVVRASGARVD